MTHPDSPLDPVRRFVDDVFDGDPGRAIQQIADLYGIGVLYQDRNDFEGELSAGGPREHFTDKEWEQIGLHNNFLHEHVQYGDVLGEYRWRVLTKAGFVYDDVTGDWRPSAEPTPTSS